LGSTDGVENVQAAGPYVNFYLRDAFYLDLLKEVLEKKEDYGRGSEKPGKVIVEFPSVNPNKPWHAGHLRNALLGDTVSSMLEFAGYKVERMDYIDDLGLQVAQSLWGFYSLKRGEVEKFDHFLGEQYVEVAKLFEEDEVVQGEVRELLKKMEEGGTEEAKRQGSLRRTASAHSTRPPSPTGYSTMCSFSNQI